MSSDYQLEDTIFLPFTTRAFATGIPTALVSGVVDIYENVTATPIVTAETLTVSLNGHAGFNVITVAAAAASGFEVGGSYTAILDAGTVDSVSVIGEVVAHFTIDASAAAQDLANGTDGLTALKTGIDDIPTTSEFEARTIVAANYFDPAADAVANVTLVATTTDVTNDVGITQAGADKVWGTAARILTASTNFNDLSAAEVNTQVDLGLTDIRLDELLAADSDIDGASPPTVGSVFHELMTKTAGSFTYDQTADSLEAIRDRGDAAWITATTVDLNADQSAVTVGTVTTLTGHTAQSGDSFTRIGAAGASLTDLGGMSTAMKAEVLVEINAALDAAISELSQAQPTATPSVRTGIMLMYMALRNKLDVQTSGTDAIEIHNAAGTMVAQKLLTDAGGDYSEALMVAGV